MISQFLIDNELEDFWKNFGISINGVFESDGNTVLRWRHNKKNIPL